MSRPQGLMGQCLWNLKEAAEKLSWPSPQHCPIPAEGPSHNSGCPVLARPILDWMLEETRKKKNKWKLSSGNSLQAPCGVAMEHLALRDDRSA